MSIIDPALLDRGVRFTSAAPANALPVAEFSLSWILCWNKRLDVFERAYRRRRISLQRRRLGAFGNYGTTVGIISASHVGGALMRMLRSCEIDCLLCDPFVTFEAANALGATRMNFGDLLRAADVVSLNAPLLPATETMSGAAEFAAKKDGALFINIARGHVLEHDAPGEAVAGGRLSAVVDVTEPEPLRADYPLWSLPNVHLTPYVAESPGRENRRETDWRIAEVERFVRGERLIPALGPKDWECAA